jgi:Carboxypeptidase regulatory-like domain
MNALLLRVGSVSLAILCCVSLSYAQVDCVAKALSVSRIQGRVFDPLGEPVPGAVVSLKRDGNEVAGVTTNDVGRFSVKAAVGKCELHTKAPGFEEAFAFIDVSDGLAQVFHPVNLWMILGVGSGEPCPSSTTSHRQFLKIIRDYKQQFKGISQTNATQK